MTKELDKFQNIVGAIIGQNSRLSVKKVTEKRLKNNLIKYTIIVEDNALPKIQSNEDKKKNKKQKTTIKEQPKEKIVIKKNTKKEDTSIIDGPVPPARPPMAEITNIGGY